jgi:hypothetical protein
MVQHSRIHAFLLLIVLSGSLTVILQRWVGGVTLYQESLSDGRKTFHKAILENQIPPPYTSWQQVGAIRVNVRIATVYLAEYIHRLTKLDLMKVYELIDTLALFFFFLLLFVYLRHTSPTVYALSGLLYVAAILPLTYFHVFFAPWDRVSLVCWVALIMLLRSHSLISFTVLLAISVAVKFDTVVLPGLYFFSNVTLSNWRRIVLRSAAMFGVAFIVFMGLRILRPGGFEERTIVTQLLINLRDFRTTPLSYPPLLIFLVPLILAFRGLRWSDRFSGVSVYFGVLLFVPFLVATNFIEVRAEMSVLILILPSALAALRVLCESGKDAAKSGIEVPAPTSAKSLIEIKE